MIATSRPRVLIVDDEPNLRFLLEAEIGERGFDVTAVETGSDAQRILLEPGGDRPFDLLLTDIRMPGVSGLDLLRWVCKSGLGTTVILMTGYGSAETAAAGLRLGAADYLMKPFGDMDLVVGSIERALERARLQAESERLKRQLLHADRLAAIGQLAAAVAHEINTPAGYILGNAGLLEERIRELQQSDADLKDGLGEMTDMVASCLDGVRRIRDIAADLRTFARSEADDVQRVDLADVIESAVRIASVDLRHRAQLQVELQPMPQVVVRAGRIAQVIINLLNNAGQAIDGEAADNTIRVTSRMDGDDVVIAVSDTGRGMDTLELGRLFEPFYTARAEGYGTGLGLSLSAEIVRSHGGRISARSTAGEGSVLEVWLPLDTGLTPASPLVPAGAETRPEPKGPARVLIVEDDPRLLRVLIAMLRKTYDVTGGGGGAAAIEALRDGAFDLILCDLMMPDVDGMAVHAHVSEHAPELEPRMLFITGGAVTLEAKRFLSAVQDRVVHKPCTRAELLAAVGLRLSAKGS